MSAGELPPAPSGGDVLRWAVQPASSGAAEDLEWASAELAQYRAAAAAGEPREDLIRVYVPRPTVAERRKPVPFLVQRGWAHFRSDRRDRERAVAAGFTPVPKARLKRMLREAAAGPR